MKKPKVGTLFTVTGYNRNIGRWSVRGKICMVVTKNIAMYEGANYHKTKRIGDYYMFNPSVKNKSDQIYAIVMENPNGEYHLPIRIGSPRTFTKYCEVL